MMKYRWYMSLSSYEGMCPGAYHWYVRLTSEANELAKHGIVVEKDKSERFETKDAAIKEAVRQFKKMAKGHLLLKGRKSILDPQEVVVGPSAIKEKANRLWLKFEQLNGWDCPKEQEPKVQEICDAWDAVMKDYTR